MKYLTIKTPICSFSGDELTDATKSGEDKVIRVQDILMQYVGSLFQAKDAKKSLLAYHVGQKLFNAVGSQLDLEDAEFELLEEALKEPKHSPMILGPVYEAMETAKKETPAEKE